MAAPFDPQVGQGCAVGGAGGGAAACAGETGLTEILKPDADACGADVSCTSVSGSDIGVSSFWSVIGVIA